MIKLLMNRRYDNILWNLWKFIRCKDRRRFYCDMCDLGVHEHSNNSSEINFHIRNECRDISGQNSKLYLADRLQRIRKRLQQYYILLEHAHSIEGECISRD